MATQGVKRKRARPASKATGTCLLVQWLKRRAPSTECNSCSIPGQGLDPMPAFKISHGSVKPNKYMFKNQKTHLLLCIKSVNNEDLLFSTQYSVIIYKEKSRKTQLGMSATAQRTGCAPLPRPPLIRRLSVEKTAHPDCRKTHCCLHLQYQRLTAWGTSSKAVRGLGHPKSADPWGLLGSHFTWCASLTSWDRFWDTFLKFFGHSLKTAASLRNSND